MEIHFLPLLTGTYDNYAYLLKDEESEKTAVVDPSEGPPVYQKLKELGWSLDYILITHHHWDHTGGNDFLVEKTGATVVGAAKDRKRIAKLSQELKDGDLFSLGKATARILEIPGHTTGHIAYYFAREKLLFCGDTLFSVGCGRVFEGDAAMMWQALKKLRDLPDDTKIYCGHEYTLKNIQFAKTVEPDNSDLLDYEAKIQTRRNQGHPSLPSTIGLEKKLNPFFRADLFRPSDPVQKFAELRQAKDRF